jgi:hypothetical protein
MKVYETKHEPAKEVTRKVGIICDLCKKQSKGYDWEDGCYDRNETEIKRRVGTVYPEGGTVHETEIDLCPECFDNKLIPWFKDQGVEPVTTDIDF